jgi:Ca2+-binding RTX toxin-like protein
MTMSRIIKLDAFEDLFEQNYTVTARAETSWTVQFTSGKYAGYELVLTGVGFTGDGGLPSDGTINSILFSNGQDEPINISGLDLPAARLYRAAELDDRDEHDGHGGHHDHGRHGHAYDDDILGTDADDSLDGGVGDDTIQSGAGADHLLGGKGHDSLDGGEGDDVLSGGKGNDDLIGGAGVDLVSYADRHGSVKVDLERGYAWGDGKDTLSEIENVLGSSFSDLLIGNGEANHLDGAAGKDRLYGGTGDDILDGGTGNDLLEGGAGKDALTGGAGRDAFVFKAVADSTLDASDAILDFQRGDKIDLCRIDADTTANGNQAFKFVDDFTGKAGELQWDATATGFTVSGDVDGDGAADFAIQVDTALTALSRYDFAL